MLKEINRLLKSCTGDIEIIMSTEDVMRFQNEVRDATDKYCKLSEKNSNGNYAWRTATIRYPGEPKNSFLKYSVRVKTASGKIN